MGIKTGQQAHTGLVEKYIGTAYDTVKVVADNLADVKEAATFADSIAADAATATAKAAQTAADVISTAADVVTTADIAAQVAAGGVGLNKGIIDVAQTIAEDYTINVGRNALSVNPTIAAGVSVTVADGSEWVIVGS